LKFGLNFTPVYPSDMAELATLADALGYESLWIGEHVLVPFGGTPEEDRRNWKPDSRFVEPWVALAHLAAVTTRVRLGTCVSVLPLHHPVHLARSVATADVLSSGRVMVGVGVGVIEAEYLALNVDFSNRGARLNEMIEVMDVLFSDPQPEYHGRFYDFPPSGFEPKPVQQPRPPLIVGGHGEPAIRRCIQRGDGWIGGAASPDQARPLIMELQRQRAEIGKPPLEITILAGWSQAFEPRLVEAFREAGVDRILVTPWASSRRARQGIEEFALGAGLG
jgi:probable F420-dependent oxidoreductase